VCGCPLTLIWQHSNLEGCTPPPLNLFKNINIMTGHKLLGGCPPPPLPYDNILTWEGCTPPTLYNNFWFRKSALFSREPIRTLRCGLFDRNVLWSVTLSLQTCRCHHSDGLHVLPHFSLAFCLLYIWHNINTKHTLS